MSSQHSFPTTPSTNLLSPGRGGDSKGRKRIAVFLGEERNEDAPLEHSQSMSHSQSPASKAASILNPTGKLSDGGRSISPTSGFVSGQPANHFGMTTAERQAYAASDASSYFASMGYAPNDDYLGGVNGPAASPAAPNTGTSHGTLSGSINSSAARGGARLSHSNVLSTDGDRVNRLPMLNVTGVGGGRPASSLGGSVGQNSPTHLGGCPAGGGGFPLSGAVGRSPSSLSTHSGQVLRSTSRLRRGSPAYLPDLPMARSPVNPLPPRATGGRNSTAESIQGNVDDDDDSDGGIESVDTSPSRPLPKPGLTAKRVQRVLMHADDDEFD